MESLVDNGADVNSKDNDGVNTWDNSLMIDHNVCSTACLNFELPFIPRHLRKGPVFTIYAFNY